MKWRDKGGDANVGLWVSSSHEKAAQRSAWLLATVTPAFVQALHKVLRERFGADRLRYLLNNAGSGVNASIAGTTGAQIDEMVNIHFKGPFLLTQALLPLIEDGGRILNVSSGLTRFSMAGYAAYASMKGAIESEPSQGLTVMASPAKALKCASA